MSRAIITHTQPTVSFTVTINIHADKSLLFLFGLLWLTWITLARAGKFLSHLYEIGRAVVVVAWRRIRRALQQAERRIEWNFNGLAYSLAYALLGRGPVVGVG